MSILLQVRGLKTHFFTRHGAVKAVDGISYDLAEGEMVGVVGESGSGKSVGATSLLRLIAPPGRIVSGEVVFEGRNLLKLPEEEMRRVRGNRIAMVFQEPMTSLNPVLTIGRQMSEGLELHQGMGRKAAMDRSAELLEMVGIPEARRKLGDYPHQLSGGMRQRVMIAAALSCNPRLLLADEPTSALDVTTQAQILEIIRQLTAGLGTAVLLITHSLGLVARYVDRVMVMYAGRVVETAPVRALYAKPAHPYTRGLLKSVPRLDQALGEKLVPIEGLPPNLIDPPPGCAFRPRCRYTVDRCAAERPELTLVAEHHNSACWLETGDR